MFPMANVVLALANDCWALPGVAERAAALAPNLAVANVQPPRNPVGTVVWTVAVSMRG